MLIITPVSYISISDNALCHSSVVSTSSQDQHPDTLGGGGSRRGLGGDWRTNSPYSAIWWIQAADVDHRTGGGCEATRPII